MKESAVSRTAKVEIAQNRGRALAINPLDEPVLEHFYKPMGGIPSREVSPLAAGPDGPAIASNQAARPKPTHYKIVCISLYTDDIERLESMVAKLKSRGHTKANKSQLIRAALDQVNLDKVPKGY